MKYIKEYLENVIKVNPLGQLSTREDILNDMSGEMVYIDGKCTDIFISHADYANWLESKDEQKPFNYECASFQQKDFAPKEEPRFNIGDWIVSDLEDVNEDFRLCKIIGIEDGCYTIQSANGCKGYNFFEIWESDYHLWSIADAKPGDVLSSELCDTIMLYKGIEDNNIQFYCDYDFSDIDVPGARFAINNGQHYGSVDDSDDWHPATKEQRDLLFQKMHEAGYEWDAEKKELKKIWQKPDNEVKPFDEFAGFTDFESTLADICIDWVGKEIGWKQYIKDSAAVLLRIATEKFNSVQDVPFEQKSAIVDIDKMIDDYANNKERGNEEFGKPVPCMIRAYKQGLEDAVSTFNLSEQNLAWSEEDEETMSELLSFLLTNTPEQWAKYGKWLKSLKERYTWEPSSELDEASYQVGIKRVLENPESYGLTKYNWKPSNDQLYILNWLANVKLGDSVVEQEVSKHLNELYKDLKKLREE